MIENYEPNDNYKSHIQCAISISAEYNYCISIPVKILNTKEAIKKVLQSFRNNVIKHSAVIRC